MGAKESKTKDMKQPKGRPRKYLPNPFINANGLERLMKSVITSKHSPIDLNELGMEILQLARGSRGLARMMWRDYREAQKGSPERARFYTLVMTLLEKCWERDRVGDVESMEDEDIEAQINLQFHRLGLGRAAECEGCHGDGEGI